MALRGVCVLLVVLVAGGYFFEKAYLSDRYRDIPPLPKIYARVLPLHDARIRDRRVLHALVPARGRRSLELRAVRRAPFGRPAVVAQSRLRRLAAGDPRLLVGTTT